MYFREAISWVSDSVLGRDHPLSRIGGSHHLCQEAEGVYRDGRRCKAWSINHKAGLRRKVTSIASICTKTLATQGF